MPFVADRKELVRLKENKDVLVEIEGNDIMKRWIVTIAGVQGTLYEGETFQLGLRFDDQYPMEPPEVVFIGTVPIHPHVYSNGHICLSILGDGWSPALRVDSICMSIVSMLSSCVKKEPPEDDSRYTLMAGSRSPKQTKFAYHDDTV